MHTGSRMDNIYPPYAPMEYRNSLENYFHTMGILTLFTPLLLFLHNKEEVTPPHNLQKLRRLTHLH